LNITTRTTNFKYVQNSTGCFTVLTGCSWL